MIHGQILVNSLGNHWVKQTVDSQASPELSRAVQRSEAERGPQGRRRGDQFRAKAVVPRKGQGAACNGRKKRNRRCPLCVVGMVPQGLARGWPRAAMEEKKPNVNSMNVLVRE